MNEKILMQKTRGLAKRNGTQTSIIENLKENHIISDSAIDVLKKSLSAGAVSLNNHCSTNIYKTEIYSAELLLFAVTLHFYWCKSYEYVRRTFNCYLPRVRTLRKWYESVSGGPELTKVSMTTLKLKVTEAPDSGRKVVCALVMDEMAIRKACGRRQEAVHRLYR